jgi:phosphodiesterase/alkaline phosphatase D-like protein
MKPWARARGSAAYYAHWDDHEFINDFSPRTNRFEIDAGTFNINGRKLYDRGVRAFTDYNPITYSKRNGIYRSVRWGKNLEIFFLDERSFRSRNADTNGACDNPQTGEPDIAPTAPQTTRNLFSILVPALSEPVSQQCLDAINDPKRTLLGSRQFKRFKRDILNSNAKFKVIMNELPIQQYYALPYDRWEGFAAERRKLINFLRNRVKNVVFLSTDVHANMVNDVRVKTLEQGGPVDSGIVEATTGPVATATYTVEINRSTGGDNANSIQQFFFKPPPPAGVGMQCASLDYFSYAEVTVRRSKLRIDLKRINGEPVPDNADRETEAPPCASIVIPAE